MPFKNKLKDVDYYMEQMGHGILSSFSEDQNKAVRLVLAKAIRIPSKKLIDLNVPFWFIKKYYMQFYMGEDKRKGRRKPKIDQMSENIIYRDYKYFYSTLPKEVTTSLNFEQKRTVQDILKRCILVPTKKIYESNKTFRFLGKDMYTSFFLGFDQRKGHRIGSTNRMRGLNMGVRSFIYFLEIAIAVAIVFSLIKLIGSFVNFNPADAIDDGMLDDMIQDKIGEKMQEGGYVIPNPFEIIDYFWWNFLKPMF